MEVKFSIYMNRRVFVMKADFLSCAVHTLYFLLCYKHDDFYIYMNLYIYFLISHNFSGVVQVFVVTVSNFFF